MTERQTQILDYIREHIDAQGYAPLVREIGTRIGVRSTSVVNFHLDKLARAGLIAREPGISRGLTLPGVASVRVGDEIEAETLDGVSLGRVRFLAPIPKAA